MPSRMRTRKRRSFRPLTRKRRPNKRFRRRAFRGRSRHARGLSIQRPYAKSRLIADREHVKLVCVSAPIGLAVLESPGAGLYWHVGKIKLNSIEIPGNDWMLGRTLPIHYPTDLFMYQSRYQRYRVTASKLEMWITANTGKMDEDDEYDFNVTVTPVNWTNTGGGQATPLTSYEQACSQPYTSIHRYKTNQTSQKRLYIKRIIDVGRLFGGLGNWASADWAGTLNVYPAAPTNPARLSHWHIGFAHFNNNAIDGVLHLNIETKMTYYTSLYDKRTVADPDPPLLDLGDRLPLGVQGVQGQLFVAPSYSCVPVH